MQAFGSPLHGACLVHLHLGSGSQGVLAVDIAIAGADVKALSSCPDASRKHFHHEQALWLSPNLHIRSMARLHFAMMHLLPKQPFA